VIEIAAVRDASFAGFDRGFEFAELELERRSEVPQSAEGLTRSRQRRLAPIEPQQRRAQLRHQQRGQRRAFGRFDLDARKAAIRRTPMQPIEQHRLAYSA